MKPRPALAAALALALSGCGYQFAPRTGALPPHTDTVAVPPFVNHTDVPSLSQRLSAAVADEMIRRTHVRVQPAIGGAEVVVHGEVLSKALNVVTFDSTGTRATTVEVVVHLKVWAGDQAGKELFRNDDMVFHDQYEISTSQQDFFEEDSAAYQRLCNTMAQTIVADILEAF